MFFLHRGGMFFFRTWDLLVLVLDGNRIQVSHCRAATTAQWEIGVVVWGRERNV